MPMNYSQQMSIPPPPPQSAMPYQQMPPSPSSFSNSEYPAKLHDPPLPPPPGNYWHVPN